MGKIKGWTKKFRTKQYTEWWGIKRKLRERVVVQITRGYGWYVYHVNPRGYDSVRTIGYSKKRSVAEKKAISFMKRNPR